MTLYTSDISKTNYHRQLNKAITAYIAVTAFCIVFDRVYALFGHGVSSASMSLMFLYPLIGGVLLFILLRIFVPYAVDIKYYRLFVNCYNSGIATLTLASALDGVFEIAGTSSSYLIFFSVSGWLLIILGLITLITNLFKF